MPYSTQNPARLATQSMAEQVNRNWHLEGTDAQTVVRVNGYITNARALGMKVGDTVKYIKTNDNPVSGANFIVSVINANGSANLSDGVAVAGTNTD